VLTLSITVGIRPLHRAHASAAASPIDVKDVLALVAGEQLRRAEAILTNLRDR
jgi:hypothetical protein